MSFKNSMMKHLRYDCYGSPYGKDYKHPMQAMKDLGITYQHATPQSMAYQWWFWNCENIPKYLPTHITELKLDPMKCIGNGLDQELAEMIRDYKKEIVVGARGRRQIGVRFHVNPIVKDIHLDYVRSLFSGMGLNIYYSPDEFINVEIPE